MLKFPLQRHRDRDKARVRVRDNQEHRDRLRLRARASAREGNRVGNREARCRSRQQLPGLHILQMA